MSPRASAAMSAYIYPIALAIISVLVATLEYFFPWRKEQKQLRKTLPWDFLHLIFNGHFLGVIFYGVSVHRILPWLDRQLEGSGVMEALQRNAAMDWPVWLQILIALFVIDFVQWCVHNLLHRVPFLWEFHKCHHSVEDGEMDWIVSFRFQWTEVVVYKVIQYFPMAFFGFGEVAVLTHAIFGTLIGHLNHANLNIGKGPIKYILNTPRMHIWHHDYEGDTRTTVNFGIIFSIWDWVFGTAKLPDHPPAKLGFDGVETFPKNFFAAEAWPASSILGKTPHPAFATGVGLALLGFGWWLHLPPAADTAATPMMGEVAATSQPASEVVASASAYSDTPEEASEAISAFGSDAEEAGYARPEFMVSANELARALGAPELIILDVRPEERFAEGHIPSALQMYREHYSASEPFPGISFDAAQLQASLRARGVSEDSVVVAYTDGGPEAYRFWWTLRDVAGYDVRVLDGGLQQWSANGHALAMGDGLDPAEGDITLAANDHPRRALWADVQSYINENNGAVLIDTRSAAEFSGEEQHRKAERAGHIPGARHMEWYSIVRDEDSDHRLQSPEDLEALFAEAGIDRGNPVVTYCQSGTRSAGTYFALFQLGWSEDEILNYDGSWAEYSRLDLPIEP